MAGIDSSSYTSEKAKATNKPGPVYLIFCQYNYQYLTFIRSGDEQVHKARLKIARRASDIPVHVCDILSPGTALLNPEELKRELALMNEERRKELFDQIHYVPTFLNFAIHNNKKKKPELAEHMKKEKEWWYGLKNLIEELEEVYGYAAVRKAKVRMIRTEPRTQKKKERSGKEEKVEEDEEATESEGESVASADTGSSTPVYHRQEVDEGFIHASEEPHRVKKSNIGFDDSGITYIDVSHFSDEEEERKNKRSRTEGKLRGKKGIKGKRETLKKRFTQEELDELSDMLVYLKPFH